MHQLHHEIIPGNPQNTIVFLHGLMGRGKNLKQLAQRLNPVGQAVLVDLPNHGKSFWTDKFSYQASADAVARLINQLKNVGEIQNLHLVGHSMGGKVAMQLALSYPDLIDTLTVIDISPVPARSLSPFQHLLGSLLNLPLQSLATRSAADQMLVETIPDFEMRSFLLGNLVREVSGSNFVWQPNLQLLYDSLSDIVDFLPPVNAQFQKPVLWIAGAKSNYIRPEHLTPMTELFPDVIPTSVADAGHWVHSDQPEKTAQLISDFITLES